jgi:acyl-CoA hydrolase
MIGGRKYQSKLQTAREAISQIKSGDNLFIHTAAAAPQKLVRALADRADELNDVCIYQLHTEGIAPYAKDRCKNAFEIKALFVGENIRQAIQTGPSSYIPVFLGEAPKLFREGVIDLDVALISVSPPDKYGICSLGPSVDTTLAALESAELVIAQVNKHIPRAHGDGWIRSEKIDAFVEYDEPLPSMLTAVPNEIQSAIGRNVAELIDDGATLQTGVGVVPESVFSYLHDHKDLGIHSEMISDAVIPLIEKGVVTGMNKYMNRGIVVATFAIGSHKFYNYIDDNPTINLLDCAYVNSTKVISKNPKVTAVNSALEIDLTGQICADSIGSKIYSGVGGQMDFMRGASLSERGKPIIAMSSTTKAGQSKIVPYLQLGAGVVTTRAHVHYVVTEYGSVNLYGRTIKERSELLASIAHPVHREWLLKKAYELWK